MTRNYAKPSKVKMLRLAESHSGGELVTPCRLLAVFVVSTAMVLIMSFSVAVNDSYHGDSVNNGDDNFTFKPYRYRLCLGSYMYLLN